MRWARPVLVVAILGLSGCVVLGRNTSGTVPAAAAVAALSEGATIDQVLERLGAPLEYFMAPDGLLLVWRERRYDYDRLELDASRGLSFVSLDPIVGSVLNNLRLVLERGKLHEERIAVLFDQGGRVIAVAHRDAEGTRLR
jgi:hypothetical protein